MDKNANKSESALREEGVLNFWKENKIFQKTLDQTKGKKEFTFYEGPPTANGKPGIHHLEARAFKDVIPRYKTMQGFHVRRKAGWDTHGLPVELEVEKELGLKSKKEIEEYGIDKFNKKCKESVWKYLDLWNVFTERIGFWLDQENPYITYDKDYMESVWNVIKEVDKQKLLYKDYKVVPWCPRCQTVLSSHEMAQGYETVKDLSVTVKFKVKGEENTYILAWTTTPWTLPGNVALAVGEKIDYIKVENKKELGVFLIMSKDYFYKLHGTFHVEEPESGLAKDVKFDPEYNVIELLKGKDLIGLEYEPLYPFLKNTISESEKMKLEKAYKVYEANFVTTEDGTGVVHTAVMYGQDDFVLGTEIGLPKHHLVGLDGKFLKGTDFLEGRFVRDEEVAVDIIKDLAYRGLLFKKEKYEHSYPHCWRCKTALIYYARDSWYIKMSALRDKLVKENEKINWEPNHIKEGRFGEWLREIKDWAISRERYWGTPLPVWICKDCREKEVIGGVDDLKKKVKKSGNRYFVMRHGEAENNVLEICSTKMNNTYHLTEKGRNQVIEASKTLVDKKIDLIFSSPFLRTRETTEIITKIINYSQENIKEDLRLVEVSDGVFDGGLMQNVNNSLSRYDNAPERGESLIDVKKRIGEFIYEIDKKYQNKKILIITHAGAAWSLFSAINGLDKKETMVNIDEINYFTLKNAEIKEFNFTPLPHNENYELDLHKPYVDEIKLDCSCGGEMNRTLEVLDCWFDSGSMPFAQDHYPFETKKIAYPADFIAEAIDQTRGWFYVLLAIGVLMGKGTPYKNVICLGHILDAEGKKMSKSIGNVIDPWIMMEKYGVDTLRLWMYSVNQPGESKNFDEKTVLELHRQVFGLLYNVLAFYELYRDKDLEKNIKKVNSKNILDQWILARLDELIILSGKNLDNYRMLEPTRAIKDFIGDLSTWYLRRSRERIKNEAANPELEQAQYGARQTLYYVLKTLAKIMAPFTPFASEDIWQRLKNEKDEESVHLAIWPAHKKNLLDLFRSMDNSVLEYMQWTRDLVRMGLEQRQKAGIRVRQPLSKISFSNVGFSGKHFVIDLFKEYVEILKDELNVKNYQIDDNLPPDTVLLDTKITPELKEEGNYRELVRAIQDMRKKVGLTPSDVISLLIETNEEGKKLIQKFEIDMKKIVLAEKIEFNENNGNKIKIDNLMFKIKLEKL